MLIATHALVTAAMALAAAVGWLAAGRDPFDVELGFESDPYLIASARTVLAAQPDPLSGIEHEPMGV